MKKLSLTLAVVLCCGTAFAQEKTNKKNSEYKFTTVKNIESTAVQNQGRTGTCWTFSSLSFFESELLRMGKPKDLNLSEMYVVRTSYPLKAENYIRMHGKAQFAEGGEFHDVVHVLRNYGMVPQEIYNGNLNAEKGYNHKEMDSVLLAQVKPIANSSEKINPPEWRMNFNKTLDSYLGEVPQKFTYKGKEYTPMSYAKELGLNPDDYVFITSFTHHAFYKPFVIEIPDNWAWQEAYNVPLDEFVAITDNAINNGYGLGWAADVSEPYFKHKEGLAILPEGWDKMSKEEQAAAYTKPVKQQTVTQDMRQLAFDNFETQDDHGMHITGMVKDQNGTKYYIIKNSWGNTSNECDGYFYASESYFRYKTISIMVNKKALPAATAKKLGIK
jgi:bleomycin hydrolase